MRFSSLYYILRPPWVDQILSTLYCELASLVRGEHHNDSCVRADRQRAGLLLAALSGRGQVRAAAGRAGTALHTVTDTQYIHAPEPDLPLKEMSILRTVSLSNNLFQNFSQHNIHILQHLISSYKRSIWTNTLFYKMFCLQLHNSILIIIVTRLYCTLFRLNL